MRNSFFPFFLILCCSLFADTDWDDDYDSSWSPKCYITYGGMEILCDQGCGDPQYDRNAGKIAYLCCEWLQKPIYPDGNSWRHWMYAEHLNLVSWKHDTLAHSDWEGCFERFEDCENEGLSHDEFLEVSSKFLAEIDDVSFDYHRDIQLHTKNIQTIKDFEKRGARFIEFGEDGEIEGYKSGSFNSLTVKRALESEQGRIEWCQRSLDRYDRYREYADATFQEVDETYRKIFIYCLENHQPEGISFRAALDNLLANNLDDALDRIHYLVDLAEAKNWDEKLIAKMQFLQGQIENELCLYGDAIVDLTLAIQKDPGNKEAYFERARAYFETGKFESAFQDFLVSEAKSSPIDSRDVDRLSFSAGMVAGISKGALEGTSEFIPSLLTSMKTLGSGLWALTQDPVTVSSEFATAIVQIVESIHSLEDAARLFVPELEKLIDEWDILSQFERGKQAGHVIGKYGIQIFLMSASVKGIKAYTDLRRAGAIQTFETSLKSKKNAKEVTKAALHAQVNREVRDFLDGSCRLKNAAQAELRPEKFIDYALKNTSKTKGFREILGYNESNWEHLKDNIQKGVLKNNAKFHNVDQYGVRFSVDMVIEGPKGKANVRTGWIYDPGKEIPRLTTLYLFTK